jgi:hypothetical protein
MTILLKILTLFIWIGIALLLLLINRVARFYELTTGVRSYHRLFWAPLFLFLIGAGRYLLVGVGVAGDVLGDLLFFLGGVSLSLLSYFLLRLMTGGR